MLDVGRSDVVRLRVTVGHWTLGFGLNVGHVGRVTLTLDVGPHTLDVRRLAVGCWTLEIRLWTWDVGRWTLDVGRWTFGHWTLHATRR